MIKLSSLLEHILDHPMKGEAIQEAKRLERIDECAQLTHLEITPDVSNTELKPLVDTDGDIMCVILDSNGNYMDWELSQRDAENNARVRTENTGRPHTVCQVMSPVNGNCPTQCVYTPEREHEWVIYRDINGYPSHWFSINAEGDDYWGASPTHVECQRFSTKVLAQTYIDTHKIHGAYPWPVPKLTS